MSNGFTSRTFFGWSSALALRLGTTQEWALATEDGNRRPLLSQFLTD